MNGTKEGASLPTEGRVRVVIAWLARLLMLVGSGLVAVYMLILLAFLAIGGMEFVADVLAGKEKNAPMYTRIIMASLILGFPTGAWFGINLWAKLMRKTGFISDERVRKMSNYSKPGVS
ncbi:MAG: hypothetical protein M0Z99_27225 [Betaproteobacteria bacterium]|nr:hypothetical protein [Betaproteobacteria bacterium]